MVRIVNFYVQVSKRINQKFEFKLPTSRDFRIKLSEDQMQEGYIHSISSLVLVPFNF
jgi:hypothetical protein